MSRLDEARQAKLTKRQALEAAGVNVHPYNYDKTHSVAEAYTELNTNVTVQTPGRISSIRTHGKVTFLSLLDNSIYENEKGEKVRYIQVMLRQETLTNYQLLNFIDVGDFLGVKGKVEKTKTGETTIIAQEFDILGKALLPIPPLAEMNSKNFIDKEVRFRKRYLDLLVNPRANYIIHSRFTILRELRAYLQREGYTEVDTPILQSLYGGTNAKPFTTHMNALDQEFYLRVAPELYLKRLIVGGYERIFEIARNFRNEGIDQTHQPEFTMVEWYEAYADYRRMMTLIEGLIKHLARAVNGSDILMICTTEVKLDQPWAIYTMHEALEKFAAIKVTDLDDSQLQTLLNQHGLKLIGAFSRGKAIFALFDKLVCHQLIAPTWIIDYPKEVSPLAKQHRLDPALTERYELYLGGKEISDGWSEITDPLDQRARFENEQQRMREGDDEAQPLDEEFLTAMEYGLPPLGGVGLGIDRLVMLLTNEWSIRETIAFPTLRPNDNTATAHTQTLTQQNLDNLVNPVTKPNSGDEKVAVSVAPDLGEIDTNEKFDSHEFTREKATTLLKKYITDQGLLDHSLMVAIALEAYAEKLGQDSELWYQTGLLHDLDYEKWPTTHPLTAVNDLLVEYPAIMRHAILSHGYGMKGAKGYVVAPQTLLDRYITAVDELSGFLRAVAKIRPDGFASMEVKSVLKRLKSKAFAAAIDRDDITAAAALIDTPLEEHIAFLIQAFQVKLPTSN